MAGGAPPGPPLAFVDDLDDPALSDGDRHHLERVLRVRVGELVTVSDGRGGWRPCRMGPDLEPVDVVRRQGPVHPVVGVAIALTKGDRPEWAVQKLTESGVDEIVLFDADRSVVRWEPEKADRQLERLRRVAREAAMQSRRAWLPTVAGVATFAEVAGRPGAARAERGGRPPSLERPFLLIGPEGGWSEEERGKDLPNVSFGPGVLRAETAAVAAGVLLTSLRAGIVDSAPSG